MKKLLICLLGVLTFAGCQKKDGFVLNEKTNAQFTEYINTFTKEQISSNPIDANYFFLNPELFGIEDVDYEGIKLAKTNKEDLNKVLEDVKKYDFNSLSYSNRLTYEILVDHLEQEMEMADYYYYETALGSYLGYQAQLPMLLYLYRFDDISDVEDYFCYLEKTESDFREIIAFEKEKAGNNLITARVVLEGTVEQCKTVYEAENYFLTTTFEDRITEFDNKEELINRNKELVVKFQDAYRYLATGIEDELLADNNAVNTYVGGKYYELLVKQSTGSKKTVPQISAELQFEFLRLSMKINSLSEENYTDLVDYDDILNCFMNNEDLWDDFPKLKTTINYNFNILDESLEDFFSPAAYLTGPLDGHDVEQILINEKQFDLQGQNYAYTTLAHEGVPGHMYQNAYFKSSKNYNYLRGILSSVGYIEGWAVYVENYVLEYSDLKESEYAGYRDLMLAACYMQAYLDIQIHYYGWQKQEVASFLQIPVNDPNIDLIYNQIIETPTDILKYYYGYMQMQQLKKKAQEVLGKKYSDLVFHTFVLDMGPMPFYILNNHINDIKEYV